MRASVINSTSIFCLNIYIRMGSLQPFEESVAIVRATGSTPRKSPRKSPRREFRMGSSQLIGESLVIVGATGLTPRKSAPVLQTAEVEQLKAENLDLSNRVGHLEYTVSSMWHELEKLKTQLMDVNKAPHYFSPQTTSSYHLSTHPQSAFSAPEHTATKVYSTPTSTITSQSQLDLAEDFGTPQTTQDSHSQVTETEKIYNGYVKSQILSELNLTKDFKKGTARLFRMLFSVQEILGRSLYGFKPNTGPQRPAWKTKKRSNLLKILSSRSGHILQWTQ